MAYVATEWVEGAEPLRVYLERAGPLPVFQRLALVVQMLSALAFAHGHRVAHGALHAGHLLVSRTGQLKVAGFGWANAAYAADSALGGPAEPAGDVRAAAAIARELLAGAASGGSAALDAVLSRALAERPSGDVTAAKLSAELQAVFGRPAWAGEAVSPCAPVMVEPGATRESLAGSSPSMARDAAVSPVAVLSSPRAQRLELALAACCLAVVAWTANLLVGGSAEAVSAALTQVQPPAVSASTQRPASVAPPVPVAAPPAALAVPAPVRVDVPVGPQPLPASPMPQQVELPHAPPAAAPSPSNAPLAAPEPQRRLSPAAPAAPNMVRAPRHAPPKAVARVVRQVSGPESRCEHGLALTRDICLAMYCQSLEYRRTPSCVRLHAQGRQVTGLSAQPHGGS